MDLASQLKYRKSFLRPTRTIVTNLLGEKFEVRGESSMKKIGEGFSFVIDEKPDLQVAPIVPGLFLSSQDPVFLLDNLRKHKIKHILSLGIEPHVKFHEISYHFVEILDLPEFKIDKALERCLQIIDNYRKDNILVHCNAGVSRSPTVIIAWLMCHEKLTFDESLEKVRMIRPCVKPNDGFIKQLKIFQAKKIYKNL